MAELSYYMHICVFLRGKTLFLRGKSFSLVPRSGSSVKVKYHNRIFKKNGGCGDICVSQTHFVYLTHYHTMPHFDAQRYIAVENILRKGDIAFNKHFLLFSQCFLPYMGHFFFFHFKFTLKCLQFVSIRTSLKFCCLVIG